MLLLLLACHTAKTTPPPTGEGIFQAGCPVAGRSTARALVGDEHLDGPDALGVAGDIVLYNSAAAYVISNPDAPHTYYHYGGILIDAVALSDCRQSAAEQFGELGFVVGTLDLLHFESSHLRQIRGEKVTVVSDGSDGGPAVVEVTATDDRFWLIEMELLRRLLHNGSPGTLGDLWNLQMTIRYTLPPDSPVLQTEVEITDGPPGEYLAGAVSFPSDHTVASATGWSSVSAGGLTLAAQVPWFQLATTDGTGAYAITMPGANLGRTEISGVTALLDLNQAMQGMKVGNGEPPAITRFAISSSGTDLNKAVRPLCEVLEEPIAGMPCSPKKVSGTVVDPAGTPVKGARVRVEVTGDDGTPHSLDQFVTDADGHFSGETIDLGGKPLTLTAEGDGRWPGEGIAGGENLTVPISASGAVEPLISDETGALLPASILLIQGDTRRQIYSVPGGEAIPLPPGTWQASVTRGYEYAPVQTTVTIPEGGTARLEATLEHQVDTTGWLSFDGHVHAAPSADSTVLPAERALTAAGAGLDVMIHTDHEVIADIRHGIADAGVQAWVNEIVGQEVTATSPEHTNAWPFPLAPEDPRGQPVRWYGQDIGSIYDLERARGAQVVVLNHPRIGCNLMCLIGWDRLTGLPTLTHPEYLGLPADKPLWDWDFDAVEYMNGPRDITLHEDNPDATGFLDDWLSFLNLGHRITAIGTSDVHGDEDPGHPRTYFLSSTDDPSQLDPADLVDAIHGGQAIVSAGAFARVTANGASLGETASAPDGKVALNIHVEAVETIDVTRIEVLANCDVVADFATDDPDGIVKYDGTVDLELPADAHLVILGWGEGLLPLGLPQFDPTGVPRVTTNAIFVDVDGNGQYDAPGGKPCSY